MFAGNERTLMYKKCFNWVSQELINIIINPIPKISIMCNIGQSEHVNTEYSVPRDQ